MATPPSSRTSYGAGNPENMSSGSSQLSIEQLREMAARQQQQIEQQQQLLVAKEQRLKYLKEQEYQQHQMASEYDKLRRLREKVEVQELKLRKLRALRGQTDNANKTNNNTLTNDLESIRRLFNEKEKELAMAVTKVDDLTRQLEELRTGKLNYNYPPQVVELEKLRRELAYRRQLNEQQNNMISQQRAQLSMGQEEMARIDRRIAELQDRLTRKRMMNQQLANQINAATSAKQAQLRAIQAGLANKNQQNKTNKPVSTVEPFQRTIPTTTTTSHHQQNRLLHHHHNQPGLDNNHHVSAEDLKPGSSVAGGNGGHHPEEASLAAANNKNIDPKYQTLPYNTKFGQLNNSANSSSSSSSTAKAQKIEQLKQEKENNNVAFAEALPRPPPSMYGGGGGGGANSSGGSGRPDYPSANYGQGVGVVAPLPHNSTSNLGGPASTGAGPNSKPISSVAPVFSTAATAAGGARFDNSSAALLSPPVHASTPLSGTNFTNHQQQQLLRASGQDSPAKLRPALPPKPSSSGAGQQQQAGQSPVPVHGDEGTSVDDEDLPPPPPTTEPPADSPTPDSASTVVDMLNGNSSRGGGGGLLASLPPHHHLHHHQHHHHDMTVSVLTSPTSLESSGLMVSTATDSQQGGGGGGSGGGVHVSMNRRIEMPPAFHFPEDEAPPSDLISGGGGVGGSGEYPPMLPRDVTDNAAMFPMVNQIYKEFQELGMEEKEQLFSSRSPEESDEYSPDSVPEFETDPVASSEVTGVKSIIEKSKKGALKITGKTRHNRTVSFDPLALLLDASLEGELDLVRKTAIEVTDPSAANDEGITALHNAICAGHLEIVRFLVMFGCDVNAQDSDGWTPLHCAASCNNLAMVKFLVEHGACIFATTLSDHETAAEKCEEDEEGFDGCSEYLYHIQEKLGIINEGVVYSVYAYEAENGDELSFVESERLVVLRKGDEVEKEWWWSSRRVEGDRRQEGEEGQEGYIPRNLLGLYPRVNPGSNQPMEE